MPDTMTTTESGFATSSVFTSLTFAKVRRAICANAETTRQTPPSLALLRDGRQQWLHEVPGHLAIGFGQLPDGLRNGSC